MNTSTQEQESGTMRILDLNGDRRIVWRRQSIPEIEDAKKEFRKAIIDGHIAFKVDKSGARGEKLTEFDPLAEEIILVPPIVGG